MLCQQGKLRITIVIESDRRPCLCSVTGFAFRPVRAFVFILLTVAIVAGRRELLPALTSMTRLAFKSEMTAHELEAGVLMIERFGSGP